MGENLELFRIPEFLINWRHHSSDVSEYFCGSVWIYKQNKSKPLVYFWKCNLIHNCNFSRAKGVFAGFTGASDTRFHNFNYPTWQMHHETLKHYYKLKNSEGGIWTHYPLTWKTSALSPFALNSSNVEPGTRLHFWFGQMRKHLEY